MTEAKAFELKLWKKKLLITNDVLTAAPSVY